MSNYKRRVMALEQAARIVSLEDRIEADLRTIWPEVERHAADLDMTPEAFADELRAGYRRRAEIGDAAYDAELAADLGVTVDQMRDLPYMRELSEQWRRESAEWQERRAAEEATRVTWRGGQLCIGGVPQYDDDGRPIMYPRVA